MTNKKCSVTNCDKKLKAKGYCQTHYMRLRRHGTTNDPVSTKAKCSIESCNDYSKARGFCYKHYHSYMKYDDPFHSNRRRIGRAPCKIESCEGFNHGGGYCQKHKYRLEKYGGIDDKLLKQRPRGSGSIDKHGYKIVVCPEWLGYRKNYRIPEHRLVMSEHLGRRLLPDETVHHKNGIRTDNRLENLELWSSSHPAGQKVEDKLLWAHEIIDLYEGQKDTKNNGSKKQS